MAATCPPLTSPLPPRHRWPVDPLARDKQRMYAQTVADWRSLGPRADLWVFAYASLVWRPEFAAAEQRPATVWGHHRALRMWSRVNRGTFERPGLVFTLLPGGRCQGLALKVPHQQVMDVLPALWEREMPNPIYDPRWLRCNTPAGLVTALAFTLSPHSPQHTGTLSVAEYRAIFEHACGRYGSTRDYALQTWQGLRAHGIHDRGLQRLLQDCGIPLDTDTPHTP